MLDRWETQLDEDTTRRHICGQPAEIDCDTCRARTCPKPTVAGMGLAKVTEERTERIEDSPDFIKHYYEQGSETRWRALREIAHTARRSLSGALRRGIEAVLLALLPIQLLIFVLRQRETGERTEHDAL